MARDKEIVGEIVSVHINEISENPVNYQIYSSKHSKEDEELESSIRMYGQLEPIVVNRKTYQIISGHRRFNTIKKLGYFYFPPKNYSINCSNSNYRFRTAVFRLRATHIHIL